MQWTGKRDWTQWSSGWFVCGTGQFRIEDKVAHRSWTRPTDGCSEQPHRIQWTTVSLSMRHLPRPYWDSSDRCQRGAQELLSFSFSFFFICILLPSFFRFLSGKLKNQESGVHGGCSSIGGSECKIRLLEFLLNLEQLTAANKQQLAAISFAPIFNDPLLRIFLYLNGLWLTGWNGDDEVRLSTVIHVHVLINLPHKQVYTGLFWSCNLNNSCIVEISKRRHWHPMIQPKRWECQP